MEAPRPRPEAPERRPNAAVVLRIVRLAARHRLRLAIAFAAAITAAGFQLWIPQLLGQSVDRALALIGDPTIDPGEARSQLIATGVLLIVAGGLRGGFSMFYTYLGESIGQRIAYRLRMAYYEQLQRLSFSYHDRVPVGDILARGILDLEGVRMFVNTAMLRTVYLSILIGAGAYLMISANWQLGLISLSFVPIVAWRASVARMKLRRMWMSRQEKMGELTTVMEENLGGTRVVRAFAAEDYEMAKFDVKSNEALALSNATIGVWVRNSTFITFVFLMVWALIVWIGGLQVIDGHMSVGDLVIFLAYMGMLQLPVRQLGMMVNGYARATTSGARLFEVLDLVPEIRDKPDAKDLEVTKGAVKFNDVHFGYDDDDEVLRGISFEARPGHTIGIVGPPGSGKSTIAHLIPRFYDCTAGTITVDGQDVRDVTLDSLRHAVGVVEQDTFMFSTTVYENVAYGEPYGRRADVENATDLAQLHKYISTLPLGYETLVGERGVTLSGGQRQRLSIARSILLRPSVIVFDDSTAAIDAATEQRIRAALADVTRDRSVIIISHRLSSLMHANEILFIEDGVVAERGSHEELITRGGKYQELYELQIRPAMDLERGGDRADEFTGGPTS